MPIRFQKRWVIDGDGFVRVWVNFSTGWPSLSIRVGRVVFNSRRGFSSVRLGHGFSYQDKD